MHALKRAALALAAAAGLALAFGCAGGPPAPVALAAGDGDLCANCRMTVSNPRTAAQIVAPGEEPLFFDDLGCLRAYLGTVPRPASGTVPDSMGHTESGTSSGTVPTVYVADHRTGEWVVAETAIFARVEDVDTPMGSHLLAWRDEGSRRQDPADAGGDPVPAAAILGRTTGDGR